MYAYCPCFGWKLLFINIITLLGATALSKFTIWNTTLFEKRRFLSNRRFKKGAWVAKSMFSLSYFCTFFFFFFFCQKRSFWPLTTFFETRITTYYTKLCFSYTNNQFILQQFHWNKSYRGSKSNTRKCKLFSSFGPLWPLKLVESILRCLGCINSRI